MGRHGENIRHRKDDDRWEGRYKVYHEEKKRYVYRSVYGHTYNEVKEKLSLERLAARNILYSSPMSQIRSCRPRSRSIYLKAYRKVSTVS